MKFTFGEATKVYALHESRDTPRDFAIVRTVQHDMGVAICALLVAGTFDYDVIRGLFARTVEKAAAPVETPRGVQVTQTPHGPVTHIDLDFRLKAEIHEDGHTYIDGERID